MQGPQKINKNKSQFNLFSYKYNGIITTNLKNVLEVLSKNAKKTISFPANKKKKKITKQKISCNSTMTVLKMVKKMLKLQYNRGA